MNDRFSVGRSAFSVNTAQRSTLNVSFIYLASQSPRRRQLLEQLGVPLRTLLPDDAEAAEALEAVRPGEAPAAYGTRVTRLKRRWGAA